MFASKTNITQAGQPKATDSYTESPVYIAGTKHTNSDTTKAPALFTQDGIDTDVLLDLLNMVNSESVWDGKNATSGSNTYLSAYNFGKYTDTARTDDPKKGYSQIAIKLFDGATLGSITTSVDRQTKNIDAATQQMWQVVYRSMDVNNDVLTVYMTQPYATFDFNQTKYDNDASDMQVYQGSNLQDAVSKTWSAIKTAYSSLNLSNYVVAPVNVPGQWQTGSSQPDTSYSNNNELTTVNQNDLLWIPSAYETQDKNNDEVENISWLSSYDTTSPTKNNWTADGRTGLWELNAYDRAWGITTVSSCASLRSGRSSNSPYARGIYSDGVNGGVRVSSPNGVRPALHLNLKSLASLALASVSASADASGTTVSASVSTPARSWAETIPAFYDNMFDKNSTSGNGVATITYTFNTDNYEISSLTFNNNETISLSGKEQNTFHTANGCQFSYVINNGSVVVKVNKITSNLNVVANIEKPICETTLQVDFSNVNNEQAQVIINVLTGTKDNFSAMQQIVVSKKEEASSVVLVLERGQTYTIIVSRPYTWGVSYSGSGTQTQDYYVFTPSATTESHTITINGSERPNISIII